MARLLVVDDEKSIVSTIQAALTDAGHSVETADSGELAITLMRKQVPDILLTDLRMSLAANELRKPAISTEAVAEAVGYQSVSAFRRVFTDRMGMTPGEWRRRAHKGE